MWKVAAVRMSRAELKYEKIHGFVEALYHEERNRDYATTGGSRHTANYKAAKGDFMEVSHLMCVPGGTHDYVHAAGGTPEECEDEDQGNHDVHLDAFGKAGKGGMGVGMLCYRCGGACHQVKDCPTPENGIARRLCYEFDGKGHFGREHGAEKGGVGKPDSKGGKGKGFYGKGAQRGQGGARWRGNAKGKHQHSNMWGGQAMYNEEFAP